MHGQSLYWYTVMHGQSLYWYTVMHGQSLYWYTVMHGQQNLQCKIIIWNKGGEEYPTYSKNTRKANWTGHILRRNCFLKNVTEQNIAVKVKVPVTEPTAQKGVRGIALLFLDLGTRRGGWSTPRPGRFTPWKDPVPIVQEAGWAPGSVWTCAKNLAPPG
jgi:hypothetical protein